MALGSLLGRERLWGSGVRRGLGWVARGLLGVALGLGGVATEARRCYLLLSWRGVVACKLVLIANFLGGEKAYLLVTSRLLRVVTSRLLLVATSRLLQIQMTTTL